MKKPEEKRGFLSSFFNSIKTLYSQNKEDELSLPKKSIRNETPKETIKRDNRPDLENLYVHIPRLGLFEASKNRERYSVETDEKRTRSLLKRYNLNEYSNLHTHPRYGLEPSIDDISRLVLNPSLKAQHISIRDESGKVIGTITIKKTKKTPKRINGYDARDYFHNLEKNSPGYQGVDEAINKYHLKRRFTYAKDYSSRASERALNNSDLTSKLSVTVAIVSILAGLFFLSDNITGNIIGSSNTSNIIGTILFVIGLIGAFIYFRNKK